jgi:hypothetical protein
VRNQKHAQLLVNAIQSLKGGGEKHVRLGYNFSNNRAGSSGVWIWRNRGSVSGIRKGLIFHIPGDMCALLYFWLERPRSLIIRWHLIKHTPTGFDLRSAAAEIESDCVSRSHSSVHLNLAILDLQQLSSSVRRSSFDFAEFVFEVAQEARPLFL